jgi:hypothetical protein
LSPEVVGALAAAKVAKDVGVVKVGAVVAMVVGTLVVLVVETESGKYVCALGRVVLLVCTVD